MPTCFSNDESACSSACLFPAWTNWRSKKKSIKSAINEIESSRSHGGGISGHGLSRGGGCRLRHHGGAACQRERGVGLAGEHDRYPGSAFRTYPHSWSHFRRAFQSRGLLIGGHGTST